MGKKLKDTDSEGIHAKTTIYARHKYTSVYRYTSSLDHIKVLPSAELFFIEINVVDNNKDYC